MEELDLSRLLPGCWLDNMDSGDFRFTRKQKAAGLGNITQHRISAWKLKYLHDFFIKSKAAARTQHLQPCSIMDQENKGK